MTIRNDSSRLLIRTTEHRRSRSVVARQGQVLLDADFDQQAGHLLNRIDIGADDMFGSAGRLVVPAGSTGFAITGAPTPAACGIGAGHGYLGGWFLENASACTLDTQPHPRNDVTPVAPVVAALKALVRHIDPVEEDALADPALGDAQASGRALVDWQVFPFEPAAGWGVPFDCSSVPGNADWQKLIAPSTGTLAVVPDVAPPATDPCSLTPQGGFSRLENLLYRIEVHGGTVRNDFPTADGPRYGLNGLTVKMSRRNASVMAKVTNVSGTAVTVEPAALDMLNWFAPGAYAEIVSIHDDVDPRDAAAAERVFRVAKATETVITLEAASAAKVAAITGQAGWFLRLWDAFPGNAGVATVSTAGHPNVSQAIDLGDGLKIQLGGGASTAVFRRGDYWTFAARADGTVDWPTGTVHETPHGPDTRYAPIAALKPPAGAPVVDDCRIQTATLTDRVLLYRGGDGQAAPAPVGGGFVTLPGKLRVAVMRGKTPVVGASVVWSVPALPAGTPACRINGQPVGGAATVPLLTGADGLCEVAWDIDANQPGATHRVQAVLTGAPASTVEGPAIVFTAGFRTAAATSYQPGNCTLLQTSTTVQEALDKLCQNIGAPIEPETLQLTAIQLTGNGTTELIKEDLILNGLEVPFDAFRRSIRIGISGTAIEATPEPFDPIVEVALDLPYPTTDPDKMYWRRASAGMGPGSPGIRAPFGFNTIRLDGSVRVIKQAAGIGTALEWLPSPDVRAFIDSMPLHMAGNTGVLQDELNEVGWVGDPEPVRVLCRLRVRSAHVWSRSSTTGERIYLNAEHLGTSDNATRRELLVRERDPQRAADLDMFFYLRLEPG